MNEATPRELAYLSQTDVTADPVLGFSYARRAWLGALHPYVSTQDPTLAGEAAAKAGFRRAQSQPGSPEEVAIWFDRSYKALAGEDRVNTRERIATGLLDGRAFAFTALKTKVGKEIILRENRATRAFMQAELEAKSLRTPNTILRDPYETMLSRHWATHEAVRQGGSARLASRIAIGGIGRALLSTPEHANKPPRAKLATVKEHIQFIAKQSVANTLALGLALSKPLEKKSQSIAAKRRNTALRMLG